MSFKTGPQLSQGWLFWEDKGTLVFFAFDTLTETLCSMDASRSGVPQQQPEQKETLVNYMLTPEPKVISLGHGGSVVEGSL